MGKVLEQNIIAGFKRAGHIIGLKGVIKLFFKFAVVKYYGLKQVDVARLPNPAQEADGNHASELIGTAAVLEIGTCRPMITNFFTGESHEQKDQGTYHRAI